LIGESYPTRAVDDRREAEDETEGAAFRIRRVGRVAWTAFLGAAVLCASCGGEKPPQAQGIEIGFFGALTGPQATFALSGRNGARLAIEEINRVGGVLGKHLELVVEDDHNEPAEAASVVSKLITRNHVVALIGENASSRSLAAAPIAQSYQVPMVSPSSTNVEVTKKGDYIFRVCFIDPNQGKALALFARRHLKASTAAILVDARSDYSVGLAQAFREHFMREGGQVVSEVKYAEGDSDFSAQLTSIRSTQPDILFVPGYYTDAGLIARQARALGIGARFLGADGWDSPKLTEIGGAAVEGAYLSNHYSFDDPAPEVQRFVAAYKKAYGAEPDSIAALSYDATSLVADAIRRAGSTESKRVRDALAATKGFAGVTGKITMDADRNPDKLPVILKVEGGRFKFVADFRQK
jgi:branched-chain amino acid transport system substrate-binding protein